MKQRRLTTVLCSILFGVVTLLHGTTQEAMARGSYLSAWGTLYPGSTSDDGASCQLCHQNSTGGDGWNSYGWSIRQGIIDDGLTPADAIMAVETADADGNGDSNITEINANTLPGWTDEIGNIIFLGDGTTLVDQVAPAGIGMFDPTASIITSILSVTKELAGDPAPVGTMFDVQVDGTTVLTSTGTYTMVIPEGGLTAVVIGEPTLPTPEPGGRWSVNVSCQNVANPVQNGNGTVTVDLLDSFDATCIVVNTYTAPAATEVPTEVPTAVPTAVPTDVPSSSGNILNVIKEVAGDPAPAGTVFDVQVDGVTVLTAAGTYTMSIPMGGQTGVVIGEPSLPVPEPNGRWSASTSCQNIQNPVQNGDGTLTVDLVEGFDATCTVINTYVAPPATEIPTTIPTAVPTNVPAATAIPTDVPPNSGNILTVIKEVAGDPAPAGTMFDVQVDTVTVLTAAGTYTMPIPTGGQTGVLIGEPSLPPAEPGGSWSQATSCQNIQNPVQNGDGTLTVDLVDGFDATCTVVNTYVAPPATEVPTAVPTDVPATPIPPADGNILTVIKEVAGDPAPAGTMFDVQVDTVTVLTAAGTYTMPIPTGGQTGVLIGEPSLPPAEPGGNWSQATSCQNIQNPVQNGDGTLTVDLVDGFDATCTVVNTYVAPPATEVPTAIPTSMPATTAPPSSGNILTVIKEVTGDPAPAGTVFDIQVDGVTVLTDAGTYTAPIPEGGQPGVIVGEPALPAPEPGGRWSASISCGGVGNPVRNDDGTLTIDLVDGFDATCTIINEYIAPSGTVEPTEVPPVPTTAPPTVAPPSSGNILTVIKEVEGDPAPAGTMFDIQVNGMTVLTAAGTYTMSIPEGGQTDVVVGEPVLPGSGWRVSSNCGGVANPINNQDGTFTVDLIDGFNATCTFVNTYSAPPTTAVPTEAPTADPTDIPNPAVELIKTADVSSAVVGDEVTYTYVVVNTGNVPLDNIVVVDDVLGVITLDIGTATLGTVGGFDTAIGTFSIIVTADDVGDLTNTATVTADAPDGSILMNTDTVIIEINEAVPTVPSTPDATPDATPVPTDDPDVTPVPTDDPDVTPVPTDDPDVTPVPTDDPDATPVPTDDPDVTPVPTDDPDVTPVPTDDPDVTPVPTDDPDVTPVPTDDPDATPTPTAIPTTGVIVSQLVTDPDGVPDSGDEEGIPNVTVNLLTPDGTLVDSTQTGEDGSFAFNDLTLGNYLIDVDENTLPEDIDPVSNNLNLVPVFITTNDNTIEIEPVPFPVLLGSITQIIWSEVNGDEVYTPGEDDLLVNIGIVLAGSDGTTRETTTNNEGEYMFENLPVNVSYTVTIDESTVPDDKQGALILDPDGEVDGSTSITIAPDNPDVVLGGFSFESPDATAATFSTLQTGTSYTALFALLFLVMAMASWTTYTLKND